MRRKHGGASELRRFQARACLNNHDCFTLTSAAASVAPCGARGPPMPDHELVRAPATQSLANRAGLARRLLPPPFARGRVETLAGRGLETRRRQDGGRRGPVQGRPDGGFPTGSWAPPASQGRPAPRRTQASPRNPRAAGRGHATPLLGPARISSWSLRLAFQVERRQVDPVSRGAPRDVSPLLGRLVRLVHVRIRARLLLLPPHPRRPRRTLGHRPRCTAGLVHGWPLTPRTVALSTRTIKMSCSLQNAPSLSLAVARVTFDRLRFSSPCPP